jgi:hypothetical protein
LRFADLKKHLHTHLYKFATIVNHTGGKFATGVTTLVAYCPQYQQHRGKFATSVNGTCGAP